MGKKTQNKRSRSFLLNFVKYLLKFSHYFPSRFHYSFYKSFATKWLVPSTTANGITLRSLTMKMILTLILILQVFSNGDMKLELKDQKNLKPRKKRLWMKEKKKNKKSNH